MVFGGGYCSDCGEPLGCVLPCENCMAILHEETEQLYKKLGFKKNAEGEWYNPKKVTGGFVKEPVNITDE